MSAVRRPSCARACLVAITLLLGACGDADRFRDRVFLERDDASVDAGMNDELEDDAGAEDASAADGGPGVSGCLPIEASDPLPARSNVMSRRGASGGPAGVFTADLFGLFQSHCGGCHVDNSLGGLHVSLLTFPTAITSVAHDRLTSDDPSFFMPPDGAGGKAFSERDPSDPVVELAGLLKAWLNAGRPADVFYPPSTAGGSDQGRYLLSEEIGLNLTNLGHCVPTPDIVGTEAQKTKELDAMFEAATELPGKLEDTDLFTLDTEVLARHRVIDFVPAYTLWADNAKKIRAVRVPMGESIGFDADKQQFTIPPNTRFYKTFLKHVVDQKGRDSYRKVETRVIVSRPDETMPDGSARVTSLFGTYAWNEDETEAELVRDPLRNGKPFRDRLLTIVTDEHAADAVIATGPTNLQDALQAAGLTRSYAIPGSERCIQCHMGAPNGSFVLGFLPMQIHRRPMGEGGIIEPAARDELNQLERLMEYGIVTGIESVDQIKLLEDSQGDRKPRNEHELTAQGYMVGNCAHCHNPRGFPSMIAPELRDTLDFMPSEQGGIFQFPLEKTSPRIFRGESYSKAIPYITPSLYDPPGAASHYATKAIDNPNDGPIGPSEYLLAPWRSLIYRNVDAPFSYEEDFAIFPRMPMHTAGYDCRVRKIMGAWMLSIPAKLKEEGRPNVVSIYAQEIGHEAAQPYEEVLPGEMSYDSFRRSAETRARQFQEGLRVADCPDPAVVDIVDPRVVRGETLTPTPLHVDLFDDGSEEATRSYTVRAPERPHFAVTDLTEPQGDWNPRRPDWNDVLVDLDIDQLNPVMQDRIRTLQDIHVTPEFVEFALEQRPFGLWEKKKDCDFSDIPTISDLSGDTRPRWIDVVTPSESAPVYEVSRGAQVFGLICLHCHGPEADSKGRLAATIADMTGGQTRVANLRDGIFGPQEMPGDNRSRVFGNANVMMTTSDDWAARYMLWMGLGGTQRTIPQAALDAIKSSSVLGEKRPDPSLSITDANMLSVVKALCSAVLPTRAMGFLPEEGRLDLSATAIFKTALIEKNYDSQLWEELCARDNALRSVRVVEAQDDAPNEPAAPVSYVIFDPLGGSLRDRGSYPANAAVGDHAGRTRSALDDDNLAPWCFHRSTSPLTTAKLEAAWAEHAPGETPPYCPDAFLSTEDNHFGESDIEQWTVRGAMNAGLSVFVYLRALASGDVQATVPYNRCEQLP